MGVLARCAGLVFLLLLLLHFGLEVLGHQAAPASAEKSEVRCLFHWGAGMILTNSR